MHIYNMKIALMHELIKVMIILYSLMKIQKRNRRELALFYIYC